MSAPPGKSNYGKVTSATPGAGNYESTVGASKYDAYAKVSDAKPQANYQILPSAQKLYEAAFAGGFVGAPTPPGAAPGAAPPGGPPARGPPPVAPRAQGAPPGLPLSGPPHAPLGAASDDKAKKKLCQRCETAKATAKVTIEDLAVKLCDPCANAVQTNPNAAREALGRAAPGPCDTCKSRPQHVRTGRPEDGQPITVCAQCMATMPFFKQLTIYAVSCVAAKKLSDAQACFEELLMLSPEFPSTLYNCACVEALLNQPERSLRLLERALNAGYTNFKTLKNDNDLKAVRKLPGFKPLLDKFVNKKPAATAAASPIAATLAAANNTLSERAMSQRGPSSPAVPQRVPSAGALFSPPTADYASSSMIHGNIVQYTVVGGAPPPGAKPPGAPPPGAPPAAAKPAPAAAEPEKFSAAALKEKGPIMYDSAIEAIKKGPAPVVYDARLDMVAAEADAKAAAEADAKAEGGISPEDLAALEELAAGIDFDELNDGADAPSPAAAAESSPTPPVASPREPVDDGIAKPRGAIPLPARPALLARVPSGGIRGPPPAAPTAAPAAPSSPGAVAKPRGPLPVPVARGAPPIAKPRGPLPTPVPARRAGAGAGALPPPPGPPGGVILEPLSDDED